MDEGKKPGAVWRFVQEHPYFICMTLLTVVPLLGITGIWTYLRLTVRASIERELRAQGLPANGLELETWKHPKEDGAPLFVQAMTEMERLRSRIGDEAFERLRDERRAKPAASASVGSLGPVIHPDAAATPQEMREQIQALAEAYRADAAAYEALFADLAPIQEKMAQAATHEGVSSSAEYRNGLATSCAGMMEYRYYSQIVARQAEFEAFARADAGAAFTRLQAMWTFNRRFHAFTIIEHMALLSIDREIARAAGRILCCSNLPAAELRRFGARLMDDENYAQLRENLPQTYIGQNAKVATLFNDPWECWRTWKYNLPPAMKMWFALTQDLDHLACYRENMRVEQLARLPFPQLRHQIPESPAKRLPCGCCSGMISWNIPFYVQTVLATDSLFYGGLMREHYRSYASILQAGIAATVAGERLEGTPWPQNLEDARFPRDPYTGLAFRMLIDADSVYIWSPGADGKDSGLVPVFHRTGCMKDSREAPTCAGEDDVVFRLPRAAYEPGHQ